MANNVPITPGTGAASVAGETISGVTYQQIEMYGAGGSSVLSINQDGSIDVPFQLPSSIVSGVTSVITGTTSVLNLAAAPSGQRNYITQILITNGAAVGTFVDVVDNGNVIYSGYAAASGGGFSASFPTPLKQPTSVLGVYISPRAQASIIGGMSGYTAP